MADRNKRPVPLSDEEQAVFEEIYAADHKVILKYAKSRLKSDQDAEDCASDAFVRMSAHITEFFGLSPDQRRRLLLSYADSVIREKKRKDTRRNTVNFSDVTPESGGDPDLDFADDIGSDADIQEELVDTELKEALTREIEKLKPARKKILLMRYAQDMKTDEIARRMSMNPSTLRSMLSATVRELREKMEGYDNG